MTNLTEERKNYKEGLISAMMCSVWWGIMPIYWQWLNFLQNCFGGAGMCGGCLDSV